MIRPKVVHYSEVEAQEVGAGAPGATIRWLIDKEHDAAPHFALRMIELAPGGKSLHHTHAYEHETYMLEGSGRVLIGEQWYDLEPGDAAFVPPDIVHQFANSGEGTFKFLCVIPV
jgi:quercetin dioxygenase-like cupin family protein